MFDVHKLDEFLGYNPVKRFDDDLCCFDTIHVCNRQTDGHTYTVMHASRGKTFVNVDINVA